MNKVEKYLVEKGFDLNKMLKDTTEYRVTNMDKAAKEIKEAISDGRHIFVVADYDVDGVRPAGQRSCSLEDFQEENRKVMVLLRRWSMRRQQMH